jgi:pilus assembly protein Flp/PilA
MNSAGRRRKQDFLPEEFNVPLPSHKTERTLKTGNTGKDRKITKREKRKMSNTLLKLHVKLLGLKHGEEGQDLVEYALLVALIALVCISSVNGVANAVNGVFTAISSSLASA